MIKYVFTDNEEFLKDLRDFYEDDVEFNLVAIELDDDYNFKIYRLKGEDPEKEYANADAPVETYNFEDNPAGWFEVFKVFVSELF